MRTVIDTWQIRAERLIEQMSPARAPLEALPPIVPATAPRWRPREI